jgi:hypothetical protein
VNDGLTLTALRLRGVMNALNAAELDRRARRVAEVDAREEIMVRLESRLVT